MSSATLPLAAPVCCFDVDALTRHGVGLGVTMIGHLDDQFGAVPDVIERDLGAFSGRHLDNPSVGETASPGFDRGHCPEIVYAPRRSRAETIPTSRPFSSSRTWRT